MPTNDRTKKLGDAVEYLKKALRHYRREKKDPHLAFLALAKAFEVAIEYAWKELKRRVEDEGMHAPSPKEAVRQAAKIDLIHKPESWLDCINARNDSVHDYFSIPEADYTELAEEFVTLVKDVVGK